MATHDYDAVVIGSGPNGLAAAVELARAGRSVLVFEAASEPGGGTRTAELTLPEFRHDICSAIHPLALASPFFRTLPLDQHGLRWIEPAIQLAHPFDDGSAALLERSLEATGKSLGPDADTYIDLMRPFVDHANDLFDAVLGPFRLPRHPLLLGRFGLIGMQSAVGFTRRRFAGEPARAIFAGMSAHSLLSLEAPSSAAYGLFLAVLGHAVGWPIAAGGSQRIAGALVSLLESLGGRLELNHAVGSLDDVPPARSVIFDVTPSQILKIAGGRFSGPYQRQLEHFRRGPGVFKLDYALDGPVPWRADACRHAGTVHLGGTIEEIARSERDVARGRHPERPFVLVAQQSLFDSSRAPDHKQTLWAYCHVPNGSTFDMTERIENQIERFAPGFRERILARHIMAPDQLQAYNANYVGGDINGGLQDLRQLFTRPAVRINPYTTPDDRLFVGSSSTPPGGGVHGMCGFYAARSVINRHR
jgi:phytoene dehydrogenase-like protein